MIRMQLYITPEIDRKLEIIARQNGKRVAQVVREVLAKGLKVKTEPESPGTFLLDLVAMGFKGPKDLSTNLFDYLYGDKSPNYGKNAPRLTKAEIKRAERFLHERRKENAR